MTTWFDIRRICPAAGFVLFLLTSFAYAAAAAVEPKRVMLLHSFGPDVKPWSDYARAFRTELGRQSPWRLDLYEQSLVAARSNDETPELAFAEYLRALFAKHPLDLIVSIGAPAAAFVQRHRQRLFPTTPMVLTVVDQRRVRYSVLADSDAVVAVSINYLAAFENILRVLPDTKNVAVVVGNSPIEKYWKEEIGKRGQIPGQNGSLLHGRTTCPSMGILKDAAALPPRSAIFWELMVVDAAGLPHEEGARWQVFMPSPMHQSSVTPMHSSAARSSAGRRPGARSGPKGGRVAVRILGGEKAGDIKVARRICNTEVRLERNAALGHQRKRLPPGSEIYFRNPTASEQYRKEILAICAVLLAQIALISWLINENRRRNRAEVLSAIPYRN